MGDVLLLGTTEKTAGLSAQESGVTSRVTPGIGGDRVELDNGRIQVAADGGSPNAIIRSLSVSGNKSINSGPLEDMLAVPGAPGVKGPIETKGPSLTYSNGDSAAYEIDVSAKLGELTVRRVYEVSLAEGNDFASISCRESYESSGLQPSGNPSPRPVPGIRLRRGSDMRIGGAAAGGLGKAGQREKVSFSSARPFVTYKSGGKGVVLCYPTKGPDSWEVDNEFLYTSYGEDAVLTAAMTETVSFFGFSNEVDVPSMINKALETRVRVPDAPVGNSYMNWGFEIECTPALGDLREGRQRLTLTIRKKYEKLSDYFVSNE
jgi:hypothetical protein